ncbi:hypothetical protein PV326_000042 [Microctonus aethiopoides]|nr:hypothetical protein PV326_000042 [Microctonus aethiopoides]
MKYSKETIFLLVFTIKYIYAGVNDTQVFDQSTEAILLNVLARPLIFDKGASTDCQRDSEIYQKALRSYESWALQMYDSSVKIPSGIITGNYKQLGNYDECLRVKSVQGFHGKACSAKISFKISPNNRSDDNTKDIGDLFVAVALASGIRNRTSGNTAPYQWLWCVPSSCDSTAVFHALEAGLNPLKRENRINLLINITNADCSTEQSNRPIFYLADWIYITIYDLVQHSVIEKPDPKDFKHTILTSFSLYSNGKSLLNTKKTDDTISCLDGLRFLSICWIIYGHTYYMKVVGVQMDLTHVATMHEIWTNLFILNGNIVTDTFFLLSGILLTYSELGRKQRQPSEYRLNIIMLYLHRYLRLTPAYAVVIGFYATLFYKIGNGPQWNTWVGSNRDYCINNWWTNLLYINNYVHVSKMCMSQSWYLSVDMQLAWISPIFLYPLISLGIKHIVSIVLLSLGLILSVLAPLLITYIEGLTGTMLYYKEQADVANVYLKIYTRVYARAGPYIVGLIFGYLLRQLHNKTIKISRVVAFCGWIFAITAGLAVVFGPRGMYFADHKYDSIEAAFYAGFHRITFALSVGWIVIATVVNFAGPVGAFLSWSGWMPLGKLTYSAYLTHYIVLLYNVGVVRTPGNLTTYESVHAFLGNLGLTLFLSVILYLAFEIPFMRIDRILTRGQLWQHFIAGSYKPNINVFGSGESTNEIFKAFDDVSPSAISQSSDSVFAVYTNEIANDDNIYHSVIVDKHDRPMINNSKSFEQKSKLHTHKDEEN